jgi:hypothetical protein
MSTVMLGPVPRILVGPTGAPTQEFSAWLQALRNRTGGAADKVDAAHVTAGGAASAAVQIVALGGLHAGGDLSGNLAVVLYRAHGAVADLPIAGSAEGDWAYAVNGRKASEAAGAGTGVPVWFSQGGWYAVDSGLAVAA